MNDRADVALPWALDQQGHVYDPIFYTSTQHQNAVPQTIFSGDERGLAFVVIPWPYTTAIKLVRYEKQDHIGGAAELCFGVAQRGIRQTLAGLQQWIMERNWPMAYTGYQPRSSSGFITLFRVPSITHFPPGEHGMPVTRMTSETWLYFS